MSLSRALWLGCLLAGCAREEVELLPAANSAPDAHGADAALATSVPDARVAPGGECGGSSYHAVNKALEILVLVDASISAVLPTPTAGLDCLLTLASDCNWALSWQVTLDEIASFVNDPRSSGISLALTYFGESCEARDYQTPNVPMGQLPEHAAAIGASLQGTLPLSETPTRPALEGALAYARQRSASPGYNARMIVVLVVDGGPDSDDCSNNDVPALSKVAATGTAFDPPIATYVFVTSSWAASLDEVARAGGTTRSLMATRAGALSSALNNLRDQELAGLPCEYTLPAQYFERVRDPKLVNLRRDGVPLGRVEGPSACSELLGGWYYDEPLLPARILTCPSTCKALKQQGGTVDIQLDCPTVILY